MGLPSVLVLVPRFLADSRMVSIPADYLVADHPGVDLALLLAMVSITVADPAVVITLSLVASIVDSGICVSDTV
jgi:hypothetical protein